VKRLPQGLQEGQLGLMALEGQLGNFLERPAVEAGTGAYSPGGGKGPAATEKPADNALFGLTFQPTAAFHGAGRITMTTSDLGNTGGPVCRTRTSSTSSTASPAARPCSRRRRPIPPA
jgi:hypothetical protein